MAGYAAPVTMVIDKVDIVSCPFNNSHKVRACRMPYHLVKCRKNHPMLARMMATCPFNACHLMLESELAHHVSHCPDRSFVERELIHTTRECQGGLPKVLPTPPCNSAQMECTEDWDLEIDSMARQSGAFIWGVGYLPSEDDDVDFRNIPANVSSAVKKVFKKEVRSVSMASDPRLMNIRMPHALPEVLSGYIEGRVGVHQKVAQSKKQVSLAAKFKHQSDANKLHNSTPVDASTSSLADCSVDTHVSVGGAMVPSAVVAFTP